MNDLAFEAAVEGLWDEEAGTADVARVLYGLVRMLRPRTVLEVGAGWTTGWLLRGLMENAEAFARERAAMAAKTARYRDERDRLLVNDDEQAIEECGELYRKWTAQTPAMGNPEHYAAEHQPRLYCIDAGDAGDVADRVEAAARRMGAGGVLRMLREDLRDSSVLLEEADLPIGLAWLDAGGYEEYTAFIEEYWQKIDPAGGVLVLHFTLNNPYLSHVVKDLELRRRRELGAYEVLSLLEPQRYRQNSVTVVRRTEAVRDDFGAAERIVRELNADLRVEQEAQEEIEE